MRIKKNDRFNSLVAGNVLLFKVHKNDGTQRNGLLNKNHVQCI